MEPGIVITRRCGPAPTRPAARLVHLSGLHDRSRSSARDEHHPGHRGDYNNPLIEPTDHGFGRSRGGPSTKLHHLVDGHGLPLVIAVTPGQSGDSPMLIPLLEHLRVTRPTGRPRTRPDRVQGDKAYSSQAIRQHHVAAASKPSSRNHPTRSATVSDATHAADAPSLTTVTSTEAARSSNAASPPSSNGGAWPPAMTNSPPSAAQQPSSTPSSPGHDI